MNARTKQQGFSLIEMLMIIGVLSILLAIGAISLNQYLQNSRLNEASKVMGETLRRVSEIAITESQKMIVSIGTDSLSWKEAATNTVRGTETLPHQAAISTKTTNTITFTGRGIPKEDESFTVSLNNKNKKVYLFVTGAVSYQ
jgi:prepilin-type N-terminal cleavage/methylation domain-containing protein